jgi:hypothetical protein
VQGDCRVVKDIGLRKKRLSDISGKTLRLD